MKNNSITLWWRVLFVLVIVPLMSISPETHEKGQLLDKARRAVGYSSFKQASRYIEQVIEIDPWRNDLIQFSGMLSLLAGEPERAVQLLDKIPFEKLDFEGRLALGDAYRELGDHQESIGVWSEARKDNQVPIQVLERIIEAYREIGDYEGLVSSMMAYLEIEPQNAMVNYQLGLMVSVNDPDSAYQYLVKAGDLDPALSDRLAGLISAIESSSGSDNLAYKLVNTGRALGLMGEWELASMSLENAVALHPEYSEAWVYLGEARRHLTGIDGEPLDGLAEWEKALEIEPDSVLTLVFLSLHYSRENQPEKALQYINKTISIEPDNPYLYLEKGNILGLLGEFEKAVASLQKAEQLDKYNFIFPLALGRFTLTYDYDVAGIGIKSGRQAMKIAPHKYETEILMGRLFTRLEDFKTAEKFLISAVAKAPDVAETHYQLGLFYHIIGKVDSARDELMIASRIEDGSIFSLEAKRVLETYFE